MAFASGSSNDDHKGNNNQGNKDYIQSLYGFMNPLPNIRITNDWGEFSAIVDFDNHPAVDLACAEGTSFVSPDNGVVFQSGYGWDRYGAMTIWMRSEKDPNITIMFAHLSATYVHKGDQITKGQVIGACGSTGIVTGPHLHLQVENKGTPVDPNIYFKLK